MHMDRAAEKQASSHVEVEICRARDRDGVKKPGQDIPRALVGLLQERWRVHMADTASGELGTWRATHAEPWHSRVQVVLRWVERQRQAEDWACLHAFDSGVRGE